jgi:hypothetical protein
VRESDPSDMVGLAIVLAALSLFWLAIGLGLGWLMMS